MSSSDRNKTVLITCTTPEREGMLDRCQHYVSRFTEPHTHLIINLDQGYTENLFSAFARLPDGWERIVFIEDDDWYRDDWLGICLETLESADVVGQDPVRYYQPGTKTWHEYPGGRAHSSLCSTAINRAAYPLLLACLEAHGAKWLDMVFWHNAFEQDIPHLAHDWGAVVGMKGLTKNPCGYNHDKPLPHQDEEGTKLVEWIGAADAELYLGDS